MAADAWLLQLDGKHADAMRMAAEAATQEDRVEKHPVTPGPLIPSRELLGDLFLANARPAEALAAYERTLQKEPNRFRTLYGAAKAAQAAGRNLIAARYYQQLIELAAPESVRGEIAEARAFLAR